MHLPRKRVEKRKTENSKEIRELKNVVLSLCLCTALLRVFVITDNV